MNSREIFLAAMARRETPRVPFVETSIGMGIGEKLLGRKCEAISIPPLGIRMRTAEDEKALARLLGRDEISFRFTAPIFSAKAVGKGGQAFAGEGLIKSMDDFRDKFSLPDPEEDALYEPIRPYIEEKEDLPVICSMRLGFLSALLTLGFETYMESLYLNPELVDAVTSAYVDWSAKSIRRLCEMGVDSIKTTDDFAFNSGPFISPEAFRKWVVPYHQRAIREIRVPWILHTDGVITPILEDLFKMGMDALHPIDPNCMDIRAFKREHGGRVCVMGNVNINTLTLGSPEEVYAETRDLIRDLAPGFGYAVSAGNSVPDYIAPENLLALARAVADFGKY